MRKRDRNIDRDMIESTIINGEIRQSHKENCVLFVQEFWFANNPVGIVANHVDGEILTVEWRK